MAWRWPTPDALTLAPGAAPGGVSANCHVSHAGQVRTTSVERVSLADRSYCVSVARCARARARDEGGLTQRRYGPCWQPCESPKARVTRPEKHLHRKFPAYDSPCACPRCAFHKRKVAEPAVEMSRARDKVLSRPTPIIQGYGMRHAIAQAPGLCSLSRPSHSPSRSHRPHTQSTQQTCLATVISPRLRTRSVSASSSTRCRASTRRRT